MNAKYELTNNTKEVLGRTLHQIKALKSFGDVKKGDLGGWIESYDNLSQTGVSWVYENALVYDHAGIYDNAKIYDFAIIFDNASIYGNARVCDNALVYGDAQVSGYSQVYDSAAVYGKTCIYDNAKVYGDSSIVTNVDICENDEIKDNKSYLIFNNTWSSGRQFVYVLSSHRWHVGCFDGTGEELIKKAYKDSELSGKMYELYVHIAEQVVKTQQQLKEGK